MVYYNYLVNVAFCCITATYLPTQFAISIFVYASYNKYNQFFICERAYMYHFEMLPSRIAHKSSLVHGQGDLSIMLKIRATCNKCLEVWKTAVLNKRPTLRSQWQLSETNDKAIFTMACLKMWCLKLVWVMLFCKLQFAHSKEVDNVILKKIELFESTLINQQNQINSNEALQNFLLKKTIFVTQRGFGRPKPSCWWWQPKPADAQHFEYLISSVTWLSKP